MKPHEAGYGLVEAVVSTLIVGILVLLLIPALGRGGNSTPGGYYSNAMLRTTASQAISDLREAQQLAISENQVINVAFSPSDTGRATQGWTITNSSGATMFKEGAPSQLNYTSNCYRGWFNPQGSYSWVFWCGAQTGTTELICFDSGTPSNPSAIQVMVTFATGQVTIRQKASGACP